MSQINTVTGFSQEAKLHLVCPSCHMAGAVGIASFFHAVYRGSFIHCIHCNDEYSVSVQIARRPTPLAPDTATPIEAGESS